MKATLTNNRIEISFRYDHQLVAMVKNFDGRQYDVSRKLWTIPIDGAKPAIEKLIRYKFVVDPAILEAVMADEIRARETQALAVMSDAEFDTPLPLFNYQRVGASFLYQVDNGLLGDEPGMGKTPMSLAVAEKMKAQKVLIFTPSAVKHQFAAEINKFLPGNKVVVVDGNVDKRIKLWRTEARFYLANYELLLRDFIHMDRDWDLIIADEATKISNPFAKQSKAVKKLRAKKKIAMTGTPISNRANDLWNILDFLAPGCMGNYFSFIDRYCMKNQWGGIFGYKNMDELKSKLKRYMIRRTRAEVLPELPEKMETDMPFELSDKEKSLYDKIKKEILFEIDKEDINKLENPMTIQHTLVKLLRLQQLTNSMELLGQDKKSSKIELLKEMIEERAESDKVIIYTKFSKFADILERELVDYKPLKITGETTGRHEIVEAFNTQDVNRVMIITDAASHGLNLQFRCSTIICTDLPFSLAKLEQVIGRVYRIGQKSQVNIYYLLGIKTVDYHLKKILEKKGELSDQILTMSDIQTLLI
jgi:SNF2 family DNA or RNA helicase